MRRRAPPRSAHPTDNRRHPWYTQIDQEGLEAAAAGIPDGQPVFMVNLLRFREHADYGECTEFAEFAPCSGAEAYFTRYMPAFNQAVVRLGGSELVYGGIAVSRIVGPADEAWDGAGVAATRTSECSNS